MSEIEKLSAQYANEISKAEANQDRLNQLLSTTNKDSELIKATTEQINKKYETWIDASEKLAAATKKIYDALKNVVTGSAEAGTQLFAIAKRYNTTTEEVQRWNYALQDATGQADLFTQSLSVMVKGMAQIAAGRGVAFSHALHNIGLEYKNIRDLSASEQFQTIIEGLGNLENYSARIEAAQQLFGEAGQYIVSVMEEGGDALATYRNEAEQFGIISSENAERLKDLQIAMQIVNTQLQEAKAELAIALQPALELITEVIKNVLAPVIRVVAKLFTALGKAGQFFFVILGAIILIMPKVLRTFALLRIAFSSTIAGASGAATAVNALKVALIGIPALIAVIGVLALIGSAFGNIKDKADDATDALKGFKEVGEEMGLMGADAQVNTESTATSMTTKTVEIGVEIHGYGDTSISDDAAVTVAQLTADQVNRSLGELTKG